jgi:hypothetical protein
MNVSILDIRSRSCIVSHTCRGTQCSLYLFGNMRADTEFRRMSYFGLRHTKIRHEIRVFHVTTAPLGQGLLTVEASRSQSRNTTLGRTPLNESQRPLST